MGTDKSTDLAVLRIYGKDFPYVSFGNSDNLGIGDWVVAVGSPLGLRSTVTTGIVSALNREGGTKKDESEDNIRNYIQIDAAINPGNSGGGLFDLDGALIGINSAIYTSNGYFLGYGFAIPSNLARNVIEDLIPDGKIQRATLGVGASDLDESKTRRLLLDKGSSVQIDELDKGSAADEAGLKPKDIILSVNDFSIRNSSDLQSNIAMHAPGDKINIKIWRDKSEMQVTATLHTGDELMSNFTRKERAATLGIDPGEGTGGVLIGKESNGSAALRAGLLEGDLIIAAAGATIATTDDLIQKLSQAKPGDVMSISVMRGTEKITKDVILQSKPKGK